MSIFRIAILLIRGRTLRPGGPSQETTKLLRSAARQLDLSLKLRAPHKVQFDPARHLRKMHTTVHTKSRRVSI